MPQINCQVLTGYNKKTKRVLAERITDATCSTTGATPDLITVTISELAPENYMRDRTQKSPAKTPLQADVIVLKYLQAMEERNLKLARSFLGPSFSIRCPGNLKFHSLENFVKWAKTRYTYVTKNIDVIDLSFRGIDTFLYCHGTLKGKWINGTNFSKIRFIDKFYVKESKIIAQEIWNDLDLEKQS